MVVRKTLCLQAPQVSGSKVPLPTAPIETDIIDGALNSGAIALAGPGRTPVRRHAGTRHKGPILVRAGESWTPTDAVRGGKSTYASPTSASYAIAMAAPGTCDYPVATNSWGSPERAWLMAVNLPVLLIRLAASCETNKAPDAACDSRNLRNRFRPAMGKGKQEQCGTLDDQRAGSRRTQRYGLRRTSHLQCECPVPNTGSIHASDHPTCCGTTGGNTLMDHRFIATH